jgi:tetratricopeptide (TPR) repeat protein
VKTTPKSEKTQTLRVVGVCFLLVLAIVAVFGQTAGFGFLSYDDQQYVSENPVVQKGLTWKGALWALTYGEIGHWHPLTWLTHMGDCQIFGLWPGGHHLTNVALHALTTVLLFLVLRAMTGALARSAFVAAVFAVHPLRAESVAWIAERKDVLSGMFFMLTLWAYVRYVRQPSRGHYMAVALLDALGLLAKNMLVTLPFVLLLLDWWPLGRMKLAEGGKAGLATPRVLLWRWVKEKIPLFLLSLGSCVATALVPEKVAKLDCLPVLERMGNALVSGVIYLRQMVFPVGLATPYLFSTGGLPIWTVCVASVVLLGISAGVVACWRKHPYLLVGWLWYLGMLVPVIGLVQISYYAHADRYTYLPGIGLAIAGTWAVADWSVGWKHRRAIVGGLMLAVMGTLIVWGHRQTCYWRDDKSLWTRSLACTSNNHIAYNNLGSVLAKEGKLAEAIGQFRKALVIKPDYAAALNNLGTALAEEGKSEEAIAQFRAALRINPASKLDHYDLGLALASEGKTEEAIAQLRAALKIDPCFGEARLNLGSLLGKSGQNEEAIAQYRKALEIQPNDLVARENLAVALFDKGEKEEAIAQYRQALEIKPNDAEACGNLGIALYDKGEKKQAIALYKKALEIDPHYEKAEYNWGSALASEGKLDDAIAHLRQAVKIKSDYAKAYSTLGLVFFDKGDTKEAIDCWRQALEFKPDQPDVQNNLAWLLATALDASLRQGAKAVALAERANQLNGSTNAAVLHTLAAAYAETGRYGDATATARRALELAVAQSDDDLAVALRREIELYEADKPTRDVPR